MDIHITTTTTSTTNKNKYAKGHSFLADLGRLLGQILGNTREASIMFQCLSVIIQQFNAIAFHGTFVIPDLEKDGHSRVNIA